MAASFIKVLIDGQEISKFSEGAMLENVEVRQELNEHWWCDVEARQSGDQRFPIESCLGKDLSIAAVDEEGAEHILFDGFVLEAELEYEIYGSYTARLKGVDPTYKLDFGRKFFRFDPTPLRDMVTMLCALLDMRSLVVCEEKSPPIPYIVWQESFWDFLKRLADDHGCWIRYHPAEKSLQVVNTFQEENTVQWRAEDGLRSFKIRGKVARKTMSGANYCRYQESKFYGLVRQVPDFLDGSGPMVEAVKEASEKTGEFGNGNVLERARTYTLDQYEALVKKECERTIGSAVIGYGESRNEELMAGNKIKVDGVLDAQGTYGLTKVIHRWNPKGYANEFWCTPWAQYTNPEPPPVRKWNGVVQARVVDNVDPQGFGRVKVQFYWEGDTPFWVRMMTPHAGSDRGFYFIPEIGDEVVVAFQDGDPERPIVLGSIWNAVDKPPTEDFWGGEYGNNDCKRIVTKSGHRIQLVDKKGKEAIAIATPQHIKIAMLENTNENGRPTMMLHCDGDIFINAGGRIHLKSAFFSREVG